MKKIFVKILLVLICSFNLNGQDIYVDNEKGLDSNTGGQEAPFRTIRRAIKELSPGKTLFLVPNKKPYSEAVDIRNLQGTRENPIIINGQNAVLSGARKLEPELWTKEDGSIYKRPVKKGFRKKRYFIITDGKPQRMGIFFKLRRPPFKDVSLLKAGEWTYNDVEKSLYIRLPKDKKLSDISEPVNNPHSGVSIRGESKYIIVKNLTVKYFINDGFNIHGDSSNILIENVKAEYCGDDGISAHENCQVKIKNFVSIGNPSGICHVNNADVVHENILITQICGVNLLLLNSKNCFKNLIVRSKGNIYLTKGEINIENAFLENPSTEKSTLEFKTPNIKTKNVMVKSFVIKNKPSQVKIFSEKDEKMFNSKFIYETKIASEGKGDCFFQGSEQDKKK